MNFRFQMNLHDFFDFYVSWEIQNSRKLPEILVCKNATSGKLANSDENHASQSPAAPPPPSSSSSSSRCSFDLHEVKAPPLQLKPFLHPEMTNTSQCELRVSTPSNCHLTVKQLVLVSSSRLVELYDKNGDSIATVKGEKITPVMSSQKAPGDSSSSANRWFICSCALPSDHSEIVVKFVGNSDPSLLLLRMFGLELRPRDTPSSGGGGLLPSHNSTTAAITHTAAAAAVGPDYHFHTPLSGLLLPPPSSSEAWIDQSQMLERLYELLRAAVLQPPGGLLANAGEEGARSHQTATDNSSWISPRDMHHHPPPAAEAAAIPHLEGEGVSQMQLWLDERLSRMQRHIVDRLDNLTERIAALEKRHEERL